MAEKIIELPKPLLKGRMSLEESIYLRRSERNFDGAKLTINQISQLLWSAQGITDPEWGFRAAPSAGSLYPLEVYVVSSDGVFHYLPQDHQLKQMQDKDLRSALVRASLGQTFIGEASLDIVITGVFARMAAKYGPRGERYVHMEAGHAAENIHLQAVTLGLGSVAIGAFWDDVVVRILNLPVEHEPLYIISVGYSSQR